MNEILQDATNEMVAAVIAAAVLTLTGFATVAIRRASEWLASKMDDASRVRLEEAALNLVAAAEAKGLSVTADDLVEYWRGFNPGDAKRFTLDRNDDKAHDLAQVRLDALRGK